MTDKPTTHISMGLCPGGYVNFYINDDGIQIPCYVDPAMDRIDVHKNIDFKTSYSSLDIAAMAAMYTKNAQEAFERGIAIETEQLLRRQLFRNYVQVTSISDSNCCGPIKWISGKHIIYPGK